MSANNDYAYAGLDLDENYIPAEPGLIFTVTNSAGNRWQMVTLADGRLLDLNRHDVIRWDDFPEKSIVSREALIRRNTVTPERLDAIRTEIETVLPTPDKVNLLPQHERNPLREAVAEHLNTADEMVGPGNEVCDELAENDPYGNRRWKIRGSAENGYSLWVMGFTPHWTVSPEPRWSYPRTPVRD